MQKNQRRTVSLLILAIGLAWIFVSADKSGVSTSGQIPAPQQGFLAPDFELRAPTGETVKLSDLRGQAVLVNLWATWCPPCREEMQTIEKVYQDYKEQGFTVLAVNMTYQDDPLAIMPFVNERGLTFHILRPAGWHHQRGRDRRTDVGSAAPYEDRGYFEIAPS
jgi:cytochrome c biogenesis protein CcmG/thiol:disulfide interchange protein DsbE